MKIKPSAIPPFVNHPRKANKDINLPFPFVIFVQQNASHLDAVEFKAYLKLWSKTCQDVSADKCYGTLPVQNPSSCVLASRMKVGNEERSINCAVLVIVPQDFGFFIRVDSCDISGICAEMW